MNLKNSKHLFLQIVVLLIIASLGWKLIHRPIEISSDVYPYLTSIDPKLVLECQEEGSNISALAWADLIAIRSTLAETNSDEVIMQVKNNIKFEQINWGYLNPNVIKEIKRKRDILIKYPYFEPHVFKFPVLGETWYTNTFGADREGGKRKHEGTDLFSKEGTPLVSVNSGTIEKVGWNRLGGERVGIRGDDNNYYYYAHLQSIEPSLKAGERIEKGALIGTVGHTGDALTTPDHLHFGIELPDSTWINPYTFLYIWQNS